LCERHHRHAQEREWVVVAGCPVEMELVAPAAPVDEHPLTRPADRDRDRFHQRAALRGSVARRLVDVTAPQAVRTVVAVRGSDALGGYVEAAMAASERTTGPSPIVAAWCMGHREDLHVGTVEPTRVPGGRRASAGDASTDVRTRVMHYRLGSWHACHNSSFGRTAPAERLVGGTVASPRDGDQRPIPRARAAGASATAGGRSLPGDPSGPAGTRPPGSHNPARAPHQRLRWI
jgi:hypothetical protein